MLDFAKRVVKLLIYDFLIVFFAHLPKSMFLCAKFLILNEYDNEER